MSVRDTRVHRQQKWTRDAPHRAYEQQDAFPVSFTAGGVAAANIQKRGTAGESMATGRRRSLRSPRQGQPRFRRSKYTNASPHRCRFLPPKTCVTWVTHASRIL